LQKSIKSINILDTLSNPFFLFFITFELFFQKNSNFDFSFLTSIDNIVFSFTTFILYVVSKKINHEKNKFVIYLIYFLIFFSFFNPLIEQTLFLLQNNFKARITYLHILVFYLIILFLFIFFSTKEFLKEILFKYYIISIFYFITAILFEVTRPVNFSKDLKIISVDLDKSSVKKSILLIVLDEYSPFTEIKNITVNKKDRTLEKYLTEKNFIISTIETSESSTLRSIDKIFNSRYRNSFSDPNIRHVKQSLYYTNFIPDLKKNGYNFVNYSFIDFNQHNSKFNFDPYKTNKKVQIIKFSIFKIFYDRLFENKFDNIGYNKFILSESNIFLKNKESWNNNFIYLHVLMPHGPFYFGNDFEYKTRNVKNYIEFRRFTSKLMVNYLKSIDLGKFNIFIISDHGFRSSKLIDPYASFFSCSNCDFNKKEIIKLENIHKLLFN
jgi:hypothetical protein